MADKALALTEEAWAAIVSHAIAAYPEECCGLILSRGGDDEVRRCRNVQNQLHALDPQSYPRDARTAFAMDFREVEAILADASRTGATLKAFYHSHPEHDAYFSQEDRAFAAPFGEPTFPDSAHIVVSVYARAVRQIRAYAWQSERQDFVEIPLARAAARRRD
jgi:proteasome lid subunit RPN8/RPN11